MSLSVCPCNSGRPQIRTLDFDEIWFDLTESKILTSTLVDVSNEKNLSGWGDIPPCYISQGVEMDFFRLLLKVRLG